jgi:septum formation protein
MKANGMPLWLDAHPLVLASKSQSRRMLVQAAGIPVEIVPASIDERAVEAAAGNSDAAEVASLLACEKARAVASLHAGRMVLGADQTLVLGERRFSKAPDRDTARAQLSALRGHTHSLHSAAAIARDGAVLFEHVEAAHLTMRAFSDAFLESYLDAVGEAVLGSVGCYQLEGIGIQLFERVEGDHATVLGLPLLPLLDWLRKAGVLAR